MASYLGQFAGSGGRVTYRTAEVTDPNGKKIKVVYMMLGVIGQDMEVVNTPDGVDFAVGGSTMEVLDNGN